MTKYRTYTDSELARALAVSADPELIAEAAARFQVAVENGFDLSDNENYKALYEQSERHVEELKYHLAVALDKSDYE